MNHSYFDSQIKPELLKLIAESQSDLIAAIAWFTDIDVFNAIQIAMKRGVKFFFISQDDEINRGASFDLETLVRSGASIWLWNPVIHGKMHHKFLLVDKKRLMIGSYNWTVAAAGYNRESTVVFDVDENSARDYQAVFEEMCKLAAAHPNTIEPGVLSVELSQVKARLRLRIRELEILVAQAEEEKSSAEAIIERFLVWLKLKIGHLILEEMRLRQQLAELIARKSKRRSDQEMAERASQSYSDYSQECAKSENKFFPELNTEEQVSIKQMYREALMMVHPDKFQDDPEKVDKANTLTVKLTDAYKANDYDAVKEIWETLKDGMAFGLDFNLMDDVDLLERYAEKLFTKLTSLQQEINQLQSNDFYKVGSEKEVAELYIAKRKEEIEANLTVLKSEVEKSSK